MRQEDGEKCTAAVGLKPAIPKSDSLLVQRAGSCPYNSCQGLLVIVAKSTGYPGNLWRAVLDSSVERARVVDGRRSKRDDAG